MKKIILVVLSLILVLGTFPTVAFAEATSDDIIILYENDVHCAVEGYSKLAAMKNELLETHTNVGVVSVGDFVQGGTLGAVSKGEYIVNLMNKVGYDAIALGNHEFDYQLPRLNELNAMSNTKFISCNFQKIGEDKSYFEPYTIVSYGSVDVAYIAITTPETINSSSPAQFKNDKGELIYTFNESKLYDIVQTNINAAETAGADYLIALSHIGYDESGNLADITDVIENTDGFDVVLDAHSHSVIEEKVIKDKSGDDVLLTSTGTKFEYIGKLTIKNGAFDTELVEVESYTKTDPVVDAYITEINENYAQLGNRKIGESKVAFITHDKDGNRLVRNAETNFGDFCSDALRVMTDADMSFVNGGGLRAPMESGDITFNDIFSVFPFNNQIVTAEISGQILIDFLEMAVMNYPEEDGSFPHMSGVTFSVNKSIPTSVKVDANGFFEKVDGAYRVYNVKVLDKTSGEYKALDPNGKYVLAGFNYFLLDFGGGMTMFKDAKILDAEGTLDVELLENYIVEHLDGVIGEEYAEVKPNISFTDGVITETPDNNENNEQEDKEPSSLQTGDNSYIVVGILLAVLSLSALVALAIYRRKEIQ
ncbi:MAG: bifunctional metallophosphatase/5'-nucleotidase [Clostridia bacterium]|nr:bifunctional metallophosphatase/5'-nucleotidase [Clostridia bacterium]